MNYAEYYSKCRKVYAENNTPNNRLLKDAHLVQFNKDKLHPILKVSPKYFEMIERIASSVAEKFNDKSGIFLPPNTKLKDEVFWRFKDPFSLPFLEEVGDEIISSVEKEYANCYLHLDKVYVYRNIVTENKPMTSWLWHYDNHPTEITKIMIYLTDVTEQSGPFEYLLDKNEKSVIIEPSRQGEKQWGKPKWPASRVPADVMKKYFDNGCKAVKATGPKGTTIIFDNNAIHRANIAKSSHRDVLVYQVKPYVKPLKPRVNPKEWTGSFQQWDISKNPAELKQKIKDKW